MKSCDDNTKLDDSFATNKKYVPMRNEDFCTEGNFILVFLAR